MGVQCLVSIIIPVYNTAKYLEQCLQSVLNQKLQEIELICVNDGSTDNSMEILARYERLDKRIKVFQQSNQGLSATRNWALRKAIGEYVYFLDSDDLIKSSKSIGELYGVAKDSDLDTLMFAGESFYENEELEKDFPQYKTYYTLMEEYSGIYQGQKIYALMRKRGEFRSSPCLQLMRRKNLIENDIWFPEGILHEDNYFTFLNLMNSQRVMYMKEVHFSRRVRSDSIMTKGVTNKNIIGYYVCAHKILEYLKAHVLDKDAVREASLQVYTMLNMCKNMIEKIEEDQCFEELLGDERMKPIDFVLFLPSLNVIKQVQNIVDLRETEIQSQKNEIVRQETLLKKQETALKKQETVLKKQEADLQKLNIKLELKDSKIKKLKGEISVLEQNIWTKLFKKIKRALKRLKIRKS